MPKVTDEIKVQVQAANPGTDLHVVSHPSNPHEFIVRGPSRIEWGIFRQKQTSPGDALSAPAVLYDSCVIWPPREEREALADKYPGLVEVLAGEIAEIGGATQRASNRKL